MQFASGNDACLDIGWYLARYPDVSAEGPKNGIEPHDYARHHWHHHGCGEGRFPNADAENRKRANGRASASASASAPPAAREGYLVYVCESRPEREYGGLGDRLVGLVSCWVLARALGRRLLVRWLSPSVASTLSVAPAYDYQRSPLAEQDALSLCGTVQSSVRMFWYMPTNGLPAEDEANLRQLRTQDWPGRWPHVDAIFVWTNLYFQHALCANPFVQHAAGLSPSDTVPLSLDAYARVFTEVLLPQPHVRACVQQRWCAMVGGGERRRSETGSTAGQDPPAARRTVQRQRAAFDCDGDAATAAHAARYLTVGIHLRFGDRHIPTIDRSRWHCPADGDEDVCAVARALFRRILEIVRDRLRRDRHEFVGARVFIASDVDGPTLVRVFDEETARAGAAAAADANEQGSDDIVAVCTPGPVVHLQRSGADALDADGTAKVVADMLLFSRCRVMFLQRQSNFGRVASLLSRDPPAADAERWFLNERDYLPYLCRHDAPSRVAGGIPEILARLRDWTVWGSAAPAEHRPTEAEAETEEDDDEEAGPGSCADAACDVADKDGMQPYTVLVPSCRPHMAQRALAAIPGARYFDGAGYSSYAKLINDCVASSPTEAVVIVADKIAPPVELVRKAVRLLDRHAIVVMKHFYFYAVTKELFRRIGMFDERFVGGGWEEYDLLLRVDEADLPAYRTEEALATWHAGIPTLWDCGTPDGSARVTARMDAKWDGWRSEIQRFEHWCNHVAPHDPLVQRYECYTHGRQLARRNAPIEDEFPHPRDLGPSPRTLPAWARAAHQRRA